MGLGSTIDSLHRYLTLSSPLSVWVDTDTMAYRHYSLRPLQLTHRTPGQPAVVRDVHRGITVDEARHIPEESKRCSC